MVTPMPPAPTGVADYVVHVQPELEARWDMDILGDEKQVETAANRSDDAVWVYQLANNPHHQFVYRAAKARPGIIVLHDLPLHYLVFSMTLERQDRAGFLAEVEWAYSRTLAHWLLAEADRGNLLPYWSMPFTEKLGQGSQGMIVHSHFAEACMRRRGYEGRVGVACVPFDAKILEWPIEGHEARREMGLPQDAFIVGCFGYVGDYKRIDVACFAFQQLRRLVPTAMLLIVGKVQPDFETKFRRVLKKAGEGIVHTGPAESRKWLTSIAACDACVNLRYPTIGESSAVLSTVLAAGKPTVVSDVGSYAEVPSGVVAKVEAGEDEIDEVAGILTRWAVDREMRRSVAKQARAYAMSAMSAEAVAKVYDEVVRGVLSRL